MVFELRGKLHKNLLGGDGIAKLLDHLLDFVVEFRLTSDNVESVDELGHHLAGVIAVLGRHHAHKQHNSLHEARVLEVQIDD